MSGYWCFKSIIPNICFKKHISHCRRWFPFWDISLQKHNLQHLHHKAYQSLFAKQIFWFGESLEENVKKNNIGYMLSLLKQQINHREYIK